MTLFVLHKHMLVYCKYHIYVVYHTLRVKYIQNTYVSLKRPVSPRHLMLLWDYDM